MSDLSPVRKERIQSKITRIILKDEGDDKLNQLLAVNEVNETDAAEMIKAARKIRVDQIRGQCMKNLYLGCFIMFLGLAAAYCFTIVTGVITNPVRVITAFLLGLGLLKVIQGVVGIAIAPAKKGPVTDG